MYDNTALARSLSDAAMEGVRKQGLIVRNCNEEALESTPAGQPKPKEVRSASDLRGKWETAALSELEASRRKVRAIADSVKTARRAAMAEAMPADALRVLDGWSHRTPEEAEVRAFAERFGGNYQAARAANAQFERIKSPLRVTHEIDVSLRNIDAAAERAAAVAHHGANERTRYLIEGLEGSLRGLLDKDLPEGRFTIETASDGAGDFPKWIIDAFTKR